MSLVQALGSDLNPVVCYNTEHIDTMFHMQLTAIQDSHQTSGALDFADKVTKMGHLRAEVNNVR